MYRFCFLTRSCCRVRNPTGQADGRTDGRTDNTCIAAYWDGRTTAEMGKS